MISVFGDVTRFGSDDDRDGFNEENRRVADKLRELTCKKS